MQPPHTPPPDQEPKPTMSPERLARFGDDGGPDGFLRFDRDYEPKTDKAPEEPQTSSR